MKTADILIKNATIVTMNTQREILQEAGMAIHGDRILKIGKSQDITKEYHAEKVIDARGKTIFPGMINTHNHFFQVLLKGLGKDRGLLAWLEGSVQKAFRYIEEEDLYLATAMGCIELLKTGVTTVLDYQYLHNRPMMNDVVIKAMEDTGIRGILARGYSDTKQFPEAFRLDYNETEQQFFDDALRLSNLHQHNPNIDIALAPGIIWSMTEDGYRNLVQVAKQMNTFITMHTIETKEDNEFSIEQYGMPTIDFFEQVGILSSPFLAVHCAEITKQEIKKLALYDVRVSYNAISNMMMGYKTLPVEDLIKEGMTVGLATDGAASNDNQNMLQVLKISPLWQKAFYQNPAVLSASRVLEMATIDGAKCVFKDKELGSLEEGKKADFFIYNHLKCGSVPMVDSVVNLVYCADSSNIETTVVGGKIVYDQGKIMGVEEEQLITRLQKNAVLLWKKADLYNTQWGKRIDY